MANYYDLCASDLQADYGDLYSDCVEDDGFDVYDDDEAFFRNRKKLKTSAMINNSDYNLNSPLVKDEVEGFLNFISNRSYANIHKKWNWNAKKSWMQSIEKSIRTIQSPDNYHRWVGQQLLKTKIDTTHIQNLIKKTNQDALVTHTVLGAYLKTWLSKKVTYKYRTNVNPQTLIYGEIMLETLKMVWILNALSDDEVLSLSDSLPVTCYDLDTHRGNNGPENRAGYLFLSHIWGKVFINSGSCYIPSEKIFLDRNMLLMLKDIGVARFQSLLANQFRTTEVHPPEHYRKIVECYRLGDQMLVKYGNPGYDGLKLVEPLCVLKLSQLAREHRPLIPEFVDFRNHMEEAQAKVLETKPEFNIFFEKIAELDTLSVSLSMYGSFRHWGHPFIDYLAGLRKLHHNVTMVKDIDGEYAETLASDLAFKVLMTKFREKRKWYVDVEKLEPNHPLMNHFKENTWPNHNQIKDFQNNWHKLPLIQCFEIPDTVDPSIIYADKSHSMNFSKVKAHILNKGSTQIPAEKVLETLLTKPATNWPAFLKEVNDCGLDVEDLVIGLKGKEREMKIDGRFFSLMSWKLREYIVFTEYLIKTHFVPLFKGLTMADDQTTVVKKMLENSGGQGGEGYEEIGIANHVDYEKWNNHQRKESNGPVFRVMGQFLGYPHLIERTHEFFEKSFIYYKDRPDLMMVDSNGTIQNKNPNDIVCWNGQAGGFEGLRQKGWSVLNLLIIERESRHGRVEVKILAQGDNQVICTQYKTRSIREGHELRNYIQQIVRNNEIVMDNIISGTAKLGLIINNNETVQSSDLIIYGKSVVYRGNFLCLEEKRYSRITCTTNDQLPNLGNIMATVVTNCLTVAHFSLSVINSIINYNWIANFARNMIEMYDPALRAAPFKILNKKYNLNTPEYKVACIYLDPALGGIGGMSLTRFHIRQFPDPVTESLSFWRQVYRGTNEAWLRNLCIVIGNPPLKSYDSKHFSKLLEDPASLNLTHGMSATTMLKEKVKEGLIKNIEKIGHGVIRHALEHLVQHQSQFDLYLESIQPCFPRFLSEFKSSTYHGVAESVVGLIQNSRTIRNLMKDIYQDELDKIIVKSEIQALQFLTTRCQPAINNIWTCSASQADLLRELSWGRKLIGTTIPHPAEMFKQVPQGRISCTYCPDPSDKSYYLTVSIPKGIRDPHSKRGPYPPYLGSRTSETTSLIQPWEKETNLPFIKRAANMRKAISWFVNPNSNLATTIISNLKSLTGIDCGRAIESFQRTGSALHRFNCNRQSTGGYIAQSPTTSTYTIVSTDPLQPLGEKNKDFMFQSSMLYAQQTAGELSLISRSAGFYHFHVDCLGCVRDIEEPTLDAPLPYEFDDVSHLMESWKPEGTEWFSDKILYPIERGPWEELNFEIQSYYVGRTIGFAYTDTRVSGGGTAYSDSLFPITLQNKVSPKFFLEGLVDGVFRGSCLTILHRRLKHRAESNHWKLLNGEVQWSLRELSAEPRFLSMVRNSILEQEVDKIPHRVPPSYPANLHDTGVRVRTYLVNHWINNYFIHQRGDSRYPDLWIFSDMSSPGLIGIFVIADRASYILTKGQLSTKDRTDIITLSGTSGIARDGLLSEELLKTYSHHRLFHCSREIRHCIKSIHHDLKLNQTLEFDGSELFFEEIETCDLKIVQVRFSATRSHPRKRIIPRIQNPLISGLRLAQIATGSFYKLNSILEYFVKGGVFALAAGDGSGGIGSLILRKYPLILLVFNSLLDMKGVNLGGTTPSPPSAIQQLNHSMRSRCINLNDAWLNPSDLRYEETWDYFKRCCDIRQVKGYDIMTFDMEVKNEVDIEAIEKLAERYIPILLNQFGVVIFKTYLYRLLLETNILTRIGYNFKNISLVQTEFSSSHTSEIYVVFSELTCRPPGETFIHYPSLELFFDNVYCFSDYKDEFSRAIDVQRKDMVKGIPQLLLPLPDIELTHLLISLGVESANAGQLGDELRRSSEEYGFTFSMILIIVVSNSIVNTTRMGPYIDFIPSDQKVCDLGGFLVGMFLWFSLQNKSLYIGMNAQSCLDKTFPFSYQYTKEVMHGKQVFRFKWSLSGLYQAHKSLYLDGKMALIGSIIRILSRKFENCNRDVNWERVNHQISKYNKKLSCPYIQRNTGALDLLFETYKHPQTTPTAILKDQMIEISPYYD